MQTLRQKSQLFTSRTISCEVGHCVPRCRTLLLGRPHGPRRHPTLFFLGKRLSHAHQATYACPLSSTYTVACGHTKSFKMGNPPSSKTLPIPFLRSSPTPTRNMPVSHSTPSVLSLLPSLELEDTQIYPVDRNALLDVGPLIFAVQRSDDRRNATGSQDPHFDYHWVCSIVLLLLAISFTLWHFQTLAVRCSETPGGQPTRSDDTYFCLWPTTVNGPDGAR